MDILFKNRKNGNHKNPCSSCPTTTVFRKDVTASDDSKQSHFKHNPKVNSGKKRTLHFFPNVPL